VDERVDERVEDREPDGFAVRATAAWMRFQPGGLTPLAPQPPEEMPRVSMTRRRALLLAVFVLAAIAFLYVVLPQLNGVKQTWNRLGSGNQWWLAVAALMELISMIAYIALFQGINVPRGSRITYRESYQITMASLVATRLFAAGGAGGVALTAWALRRSGMPRREVAQRMIAFLVLLYGIYMFAMVVCGFGLYFHLLPGEHPAGLTLVPAIFGLTVILLFLAIGLVPEDLERRLGNAGARSRTMSRLTRRLASGPASLSAGVRFAIYKVRHPDWAMIGTVGWWAFNIAVLYAAFRAFGPAPPLAVLIQAYFVGMLANLLPLPGGIGGVDGGMIGAFVAFGVSGSLALVAVLIYRFFAFWLPTLPGAVAYFQLRRTVARWQGEGGPLGPVEPHAVGA
jgi:uncharacterized protein (TIRG00374 family)